MRFRLLMAMASSLLLAASLPAQQPDRVQAALLCKGKEALVHAVPLQPGYVITFTIPSTGVMKPLLKAEPQSAGPNCPGDVKVPAGAGHGAALRRPRPAMDFIAGVASDDERLYILTATRVFQSAPASAGPKAAKHPGRSPAPSGEATEAKLIGHQFKLHAFSLKDGAALMGEGYELPLVSDDAKATEPPDTMNVKETLGRGPIELVAGGLKCRGTTVLFAGNEIKSLEVKGKQFTPPPGFFGRNPGERIF